MLIKKLTAISLADGNIQSRIDQMLEKANEIVADERYDHNKGFKYTLDVKFQKKDDGEVSIKIQDKIAPPPKKATETMVSSVTVNENGKRKKVFIAHGTKNQLPLGFDPETGEVNDSNQKIQKIGEK